MSEKDETQTESTGDLANNDDDQNCGTRRNEGEEDVSSILDDADVKRRQQRHPDEGSLLHNGETSIEETEIVDDEKDQVDGSEETSSKMQIPTAANPTPSQPPLLGPPEAAETTHQHNNDMNHHNRRRRRHNRNNNTTTTTTTNAQLRRAEKLREVQSAFSTTSNTNANDESTTSAQTNDEEEKNNEPMSQTTLPSSAEADAFAEQVLRRKAESSPSKTNDSEKPAFQIDVFPNESQPNERADIHIEGPETEGLLAIILIALYVNRWNVVHVHMDNNLSVKASSSTTTSKDDNHYIEDEKEEEREEETNVAATPYTAVFGEQTIVVSIPSDVEDSRTILNELRVLLLSACHDFVSRQRSLLPLLRAFETTIEPNLSRQMPDVENPPLPIVNENTSTTDQLFGRGSKDIAANSNPDNFGIGIGVVEGRQTALEYASSPNSRTLKSTQRHANTTTIGGITPGAFAAHGRAFGAPPRPQPQQSRDIENNPSRRSLRQSLNSTRQWLSDRLMGGNGSQAFYPSSTSTGNINDSRDLDNNQTQSVPLAAEVVESPEAIEARIRNSIIQGSAEADIISTTSDPSAVNAKLQRNLLGILLIGIGLALIIGFTTRVVEDPTLAPTTLLETISPSTAPTMTPTMTQLMTPAPTLDSILERGYLRCCTEMIPTYSLSFMDLELCRGLAAATLGNASLVQVIECSGEKRWDLLANRTADVIIYGTTHTTSRSIREQSTGKGFSFSSPYYYDGLIVGGTADNKDLVACADNLDTYFRECRRLLVCVENATTHSDFMTKRLPPQHIHLVSRFENVFKENVCNVIGVEATAMARAVAIASGGSDANDTISVGSNIFTKEPLAIVTRPDDYEWTSFVEIFLQGLLEAEARNITQADASSFPSIPYFGGSSEYETMIVRAVESIGHFGELYNNTIGTELPRTGLNELRRDQCEHRGGLIHGIPFGNIIEENPRSSTTGKLARILEREILSCGVPIRNEATSRFNIEICKAIATALFDGYTDKFEIVSSSYTNLTDTVGLLVEDDLVDVLVGVGSTNLHLLGSDFETVALSEPYLFFPVDDGGGELEAFLLATKSDDHEWSTFVQWVVTSVVNAEEMLISKENIDTLPGDLVLFGPVYDIMFRDIISKVGNYQDIFSNTINATRTGCNLPNTPPYGPEQLPFLFQGL